VVIVAGYQGVSYRREVTTLGRGGSDTTAVAMAAALAADACEIYSDVDGVFSADPRVVPQARQLAEISYEEMQTLAESGARVLNAQAVEFARRAGIAIHARATAGGSGTVVGALPENGAGGESARRVSGITGERDLVALRLSATGRLEELLEFLDAGGAPAGTVLAHHDAGLALLLISRENAHGLPALRADLASRFGEELRWQEGLGSAAVVGAGISMGGVTLRHALAALDRIGITPEGVHSSPFRLLFLVPATRLDDCVRRLHEELL
jgi:aspartate kinase